MPTIALVNFAKYRFDNQANQDHINQIEEARNENFWKISLATYLFMPFSPIKMTVQNP